MQYQSSTELLRLGRAHYLVGRLDESVECYRQAAGLDGATPDARLNLGMVLHELGRSVEAAEVLGQLVVDHRDCAAGWVQLARAIESQGFAWEAHDAIRRALKAKPDAETLVAASGLLLKLQDNAAAESTARRALEMTPGSAPAWFQLGQVLIVKGASADAAAAYQQALAIDPGNAAAAFILAAMGSEGGAGLDVPAPTVVPPGYVRALFDGYAEQFDSALVGSMRYQVPQMLERIYSQWQERIGGDPLKRMVILDAGCGTGLCGLWLARYRGQLIGVDLSRGMIAKAREHEVYDELVVGEVVEELERRPEALDLIVAADVLVYFGDLARVFTAAAAALRSGGMFLLSVEAGAGEDFLLRPTQRFAHSMDYLHRLAAANGLTVRVPAEVVLRLEKGVDVRGYLMLAEKKAPGAMAGR